MKKKLFTKYQYDIALDEGVGSYLVTGVSGLMVFFVTLALIVNFALTTLTQNWVNDLSGSVTVEIKPAPLGQIDNIEGHINTISALEGRHPAIQKVHILSREEIEDLITPWLGHTPPADLPLPILVDLTLTQNANTAQLTKDIQNLIPTAVIDTHTNTLKDVNTIINTARLFTLLLTGVIVLLAIVSIAGIVRTKFSIHRQEVETLHLIGASDEYIARQFRHHTLKGVLKGAIIGLSCMMATLICIGLITRTIDTAMIPNLHLQPTQWGLLIAVPILAGTLIAHMTAQRSVIKELAKLP